MNIGKYNNKFDNNLLVGTVVFPTEIENWCNENCSGSWGWFWDLGEPEPKVFLSFQEERDLVNFVLFRGVYNGKSIRE